MLSAVIQEAKERSAQLTVCATLELLGPPEVPCAG